MVKIKICGITHKSDAFMAVEMGVDALGFIFAPSERGIHPEKAREIIRSLPPFVQTVGVFVNEKPARIHDLIAFCGLDLVQLHGDEPPQMCNLFMPRCVKAIRVRSRSSLRGIESYTGKVRALLLDTYSEEKRGGTGITFNWDLTAEVKKAGIPIILAGGLHPNNIKEAIFTVRPFAVDINSGVEEKPGKKSRLLMEEMIKKITQVNREGVIHEQ